MLGSGKKSVIFRRKVLELVYFKVGDVRVYGILAMLIHQESGEKKIVTAHVSWFEKLFEYEYQIYIERCFKYFSL